MDGPQYGKVVARRNNNNDDGEIFVIAFVLFSSVLVWEIL